MPSLLATIWYMEGPCLRIIRPFLLSDCHRNEGYVSALANDNKSNLGAKVQRKRNITKDRILARIFKATGPKSISRHNVDSWYRVLKQSSKQLARLIIDNARRRIALDQSQCQREEK